MTNKYEVELKEASTLSFVNPPAGLLPLEPNTKVTIEGKTFTVTGRQFSQSYCKGQQLHQFIEKLAESRGLGKLGKGVTMKVEIEVERPE